MMKQCPDFLLRDVADSLVLVPVGAAAKRFPGMITLNETGTFLWEQMQQETSEAELTAALLKEYDFLS